MQFAILYLRKHMREITVFISLLQVVLCIDFCDSCKFLAWTLRRSLSTLAVCSVSKRSPGTNPMCKMRHSWEGKDKRYGELRERTNTRDESEHRGTRLSGHVRPTIQLSQDIWAARRVSGFVFFEAFNDTLRGLPELHEPSSIYTRGYNFLLKKWVHNNNVYTSN